MNEIYSRSISLVVSWNAICHLLQLWICVARSIPMDQEPCVGQFVRLPMGLSQMCTSGLMWASLYHGPLFPPGKKLASLFCLHCKLIHSVYLWAACIWFNICSSSLSALPVHFQKKDGTLLTAELTTSAWMPPTIRAVLIIFLPI